MSTSPAAPTAAPGTVSTWKLDPVHSHAEFKVKHMMISNVKGSFSGLSGTLTLDETDYTRSSVDVSVAVATINTGDPQRDGHLKAADFFDVEKYPAITFKSTNIDSKGGADYEVTGDFTLRDVTRSIKLAVEDVSVPSKDPWGNSRIGLSATTKVNRKDFGLAWNAALETGGFLLGDDVTISLEIQFVKG
jgi:polyisoprenoid-binding protein YceI